MRTCDLERARAAAATCLRGVERHRLDAPDLNATDQAEARKGRAQMQASIAAMLGRVSMAAAGKWGGHWIIEADEANAIAEPAVEVIELELGAMPDDPWSKLYVALGMVVLPRLVLQFVGNKQEAAPAAPAADTHTSTIDVDAKVTKEAA